MSAETVELTPQERARVAPYVTDVEGPVFALRNLPEVVKAALFARYSRSPKSLRRLLVDEFLEGGPGGAGGEAHAGETRASELFDRVFLEYGDDSVAQLGGAHVAVEGASNILTKILQWGRLAGYLEQSTRYISFADRPGGAYRYHRPAAVLGHPVLGPRYVATMDGAFHGYADLIPRMADHVDRLLPGHGGAPDPARTRAVRARALDALRGLLPAATTANVGVFASGQAFEAMLLRMRAHPLPEARECADRMLAELRQVIPSFLTRVDRQDRGVVQSAYLADLDRRAAALVDELLVAAPAAPGADQVRLVDFDPDGEARVAAHALWPRSDLPLEEVVAQVARLDPARRAAIVAEVAGARTNRRHRPGRAFEATAYTFEVVCDYGAYRDLQRHRMLTLQAQTLTPGLGYAVPADVAEAGAEGEYRAVQEACAALYADLREPFPHEAAYAVTLAHRIRFTMSMNAREAMHLIELRSQPQGHESYRAVAQRMHAAIRDEAGHRAIADAMIFVDHSTPAAGRLEAERRSERRRAEIGSG